MLYDSTKILLRTLIQSLEVADEGAWEDRIESARECIFEMHQMNRALSMELRSDAGSQRVPAANPHCQKIDRAMPHVKSMMYAIRRRDKAAALESGRLALAQM
ncbi:MAG TPA: hypothetical protein VMG35_05250 [Bryobacteraceae bacterium]|nr:hypothetical protein [Bryobacteraceae bacterium]